MSLDDPITPLSLVDQAFDRIADAIVIGEIKPGERIREALVARKLGISRGVLREAMQRLEGRNLVTRTSNVGVHVVALCEADQYELYTMREALEGMAARLAAIHMTDEEIVGLNTLLQDHEQHRDVKTGGGYFQRTFDEDFHFHIARGARNGRLLRILTEELYYQLRLYRYRSSVRPGRTREALIEHRRIVAAITSRDPDKAEAAMRAHLARARANLTWNVEIEGAAKTPSRRGAKADSSPEELRLKAG